MSDTSQTRTYSLQQALSAQKALRDFAGLQPETFPVEAFVGMISDEIETLRAQGRTDEQIANTITTSSNIQISAAEIAANYAPPEARHRAD